jgi:hypothetical protein
MPLETGRTAPTAAVHHMTEVCRPEVFGAVWDGCSCPPPLTVIDPDTGTPLLKRDS